MFKSHLPGRNLMFGLALIAILAVVFTLGAVAQDPNNGEPAAQAPAVAQAPAEEELTTTTLQAEGAAGTPGDGETGRQPDKVTLVEELELLPGPDGQTLSTLYKRYSANVFVPYDDDMTYNYFGAGCVYRTGGTNLSDHTLQLPDGAEITYLRIYFYDTDADDDARAILFSFDGAGGSATIATAESSGTPGQSSAGSGFFSHFVDNQNEALALRLNYNGGSNNTLQICGVRIQYKYTLVKSSLPLILDQSNP